MSLEFTLITDRDAFAPLRDEWNDLAERSAVSHAFMWHEWFTCWLGHLPFDGAIRILLARRAGRLVGAAPLCIRRLRRRGIAFDALGFLMSAISPRCHVLVDPDEDPAAVFAGIDTIDGWDLAELQGLATDTELTSRFVDFLRSRGSCVVEQGAASPYQSLPATWEEFEKTRSKGFRKRFRNSHNRCTKAEGYDLVRIESYAELERRFDDLLTISRKSWKADVGTDLVTQSAMADFFRSFSRLTDRDGLWTVYILSLEGEPAAFDYYLRHRGRLVGLRWEFDNDRRYYMPGVVIHAQAVKDLIADTGSGGEYDLSGTETDFKSGFVDSIRDHVDVTFAARGVRGSLLLAMKKGLVRWHGNAAAL